MSNTTECRFCNREDISIIKENASMVAFYDRYPVTKGHCLIIPRKHSSDFFQLNEEEFIDLGKILHELKDFLRNTDRTVTGFNIGANCGASAGQTIFHCHIHLIPRRSNDVKDPTGGVRGVIPEKQKY